MEWVGQAKSVHPGRRLVPTYTEQALQKVSYPSLVAYSEARNTGETLFLITGAADLCEVGAAILAVLDR
ncbi:hypothetical protein ACH4TV_32865 [Streptomyces sp. NPDC020898]|uniref:hypothetical protein n=1 Tax=Streptomyces sp. NPDC020898 TaxID=3365101 RepID=UPI0037A48DEB